MLVYFLARGVGFVCRVGSGLRCGFADDHVGLHYLADRTRERMDQVDGYGADVCGGIVVRYTRRAAITTECNAVGGSIDGTGRGARGEYSTNGGREECFVSDSRRGVRLVQLCMYLCISICHIKDSRRRCSLNFSERRTSSNQEVEHMYRRCDSRIVLFAFPHKVMFDERMAILTRMSSSTAVDLSLLPASLTHMVSWTVVDVDIMGFALRRRLTPDNFIMVSGCCVHLCAH